MSTINFKGKVDYDPTHVYGPDMFGAVYRTIGNVYDTTKDRTTMTLAPMLQADREARKVEITSKFIEKGRIARLFGTLKG